MANEEPKQEENKEQENESKGQPSAEQKTKRLEQENANLKKTTRRIKCSLLVLIVLIIANRFLY